MTRRAGTLLLTLLCATTTGRLAAQSTFPPTTPRYQEIIRLAQDGHADSARSTIQKMLAAMPATDPAYPEALYTWASIPAKTLADTRMLFLRVALEYGTSPWADKAFYRMALLDYGLNQVDASLSSFKRIFADYPASPVIPGAALWGSRAAFQKSELPLGCDWLRKGIAAVGGDIELRNQLEFARGRCSVGAGVELAPPVAESLRAAPPAGRGTATAPATVVPPKIDSAAAPKPATRPAAGDNFRVQVAAITSKAAITRTVNALKKAGFTVWQVKAGATLVKIQAGPFATREAAVARLPQLKKLAGGKPFVVVTP